MGLSSMDIRSLLVKAQTSSRVIASYLVSSILNNTRILLMYYVDLQYHIALFGSLTSLSHLCLIWFPCADAWWLSIRINGWLCMQHRWISNISSQQLSSSYEGFLNTSDFCFTSILMLKFSLPAVWIVVTLGQLKWRVHCYYHISFVAKILTNLLTGKKTMPNGLHNCHRSFST